MMVTFPRAMAVCAVLASCAVAQDCNNCSTRVLFDPLVGDFCSNMQDAFDSATACLTKCSTATPCTRGRTTSSPYGCKDLTCQGQPVVDTSFDEDDVCGRRCGRAMTRGINASAGVCEAVQAVVDNTYECYEQLCDKARAQQFCDSEVDWYRPLACVADGKLACGGKVATPPPPSCTEECFNNITYTRDDCSSYDKLAACIQRCGRTKDILCRGGIGASCPNLNCTGQSDPTTHDDTISVGTINSGPKDSAASTYSPAAAGGVASGAVLLFAAAGLVVLKRRRRNSAANAAAVTSPSPKQAMPEL